MPVLAKYYQKLLIRFERMMAYLEQGTDMKQYTRGGYTYMIDSRFAGDSYEAVQLRKNYFELNAQISHEWEHNQEFRRELEKLIEKLDKNRNPLPEAKKLF